MQGSDRPANKPPVGEYIAEGDISNLDGWIHWIIIQLQTDDDDVDHQEKNIAQTSYGAMKYVDNPRYQLTN